MGSIAQILAVRDLASGLQLAWTAVPDATAAEALAVLEPLMHQYGPPLVLKSDNGSAFISERFMERWRTGRSCPYSRQHACRAITVLAKLVSAG